MGEISLKLNGKLETKDVADNTLLIDFIREHVGLTGTHVGCDTSQCGACVIHLDGVSVKACTMLAKQAEGSEIVTIEGLADGDELHPMQQAFHENHGLQCGFCTPGMVMSAVEMVTKNKNISEDEIRKWASDTTITDGVEFASTLGTIMPVFSSPLLQYMIKQLPFSSIMKILLRHPRKDRKMIFIAMYFGNPSKKIPFLGIKNYVDEILKLEKLFSDGRTFFYDTFSHVDINLMCVFNRLTDLGLEKTVSYKTPFIFKYWNNLKSRKSYKDGILDYYTDKEKELLTEFYQNNDSSVLEAIIEEIDKRI